MSLKTEIPATVDFKTLLNGIEEIVSQAVRHNPNAHEHFCRLDVMRLERAAKSIQSILTTPTKVV